MEFIRVLIWKRYPELICFLLLMFRRRKKLERYSPWLFSVWLFSSYCAQPVYFFSVIVSYFPLSYPGPSEGTIVSLTTRLSSRWTTRNQFGIYWCSIYQRKWGRNARIVTAMGKSQEYASFFFPRILLNVISLCLNQWSNNVRIDT